MNNYNLQFETLCKSLELGSILEEPKQIAGGFLHKMYQLHTSSGKYAIKALNPEIMKRLGAKENFVNAERIATIARHRQIPALTASIFNGQALQCIEGQYYLVFRWVEGEALPQADITEKHCTIMGSLLANIHSTDFSSLELEREENTEDLYIEWKEYLEKGRVQNASWVELLERDLDDFYAWTKKANEAHQILRRNMVIGHRDMDGKNVLWKNEIPTIIDWESAGYINPVEEALEDALYWSGFDEGNIHKDLFMAFLKSYSYKKSFQNINWDLVLDSMYAGKLSWLAYNLKRSLWIECTDEEEQLLGTSEVFKTIEKIIRYAEIMPILTKWVHDL